MRTDPSEKLFLDRIIDKIKYSLRASNVRIICIKEVDVNTIIVKITINPVILEKGSQCSPPYGSFIGDKNKKY